MLSITWQPLQSKVCNADSSLTLNRKGKPQKGQRGRGASMSMRLTVKSESLIGGKKRSCVGTWLVLKRLESSLRRTRPLAVLRK
jgi:hypothetical protein